MSKPVLAPGLRVLRRSRDELQIGLGPRGRVRLADTDPVRSTLGHLLRGEAVPDDPETRCVLDTLAPVLVDGAGLLPSGIAAGDAAAAALHDPAAYASRLDARRRATVSVSGELGDADPRTLLAAAGVRTTDGGVPQGAAAVAMVLRVGEIDRAELDPLVRSGTAHLLVRMVEGDAVVGPLVQPGRTACLRCIDAHRALREPHAAMLATRHAAAHHDRHDGVAEPVDTALATLAVAWAVRDVVTLVDGGRPAAWSSTVHLSATLDSVTRAEWLRHPACGCCWLPDAQVSSTMGG
jgi:bacteriocin biosynthesis cyclodehydratase domain-containing protein